MESVQKEWLILKGMNAEQLEGINGRSRLGCDIIDYYFFEHRLKTKGNKGINFYEFVDQIEFYNTDITALENGFFGSDIDILFTDFEHYPASILTLFSLYLPYVSKNSLFFVDGASTFYPSFLLLENLIDMFNKGQVPYSLNPEIKSIVQNSHFTLNHLIENKDRHQNSTAQITINPIDIFPQPFGKIRGL